ncbi:hypothetical protein [Candidatus Poriferisodalis sp.]|uniref:hypothetical protein n=1 Tax=Candidatus Poriferisodalis sp. TaxID=3101277 RepID=UPI003AF5F345
MDDRPVLHDAVTLRHFSAANRLDVLEDIHGSLPEPRVAPAVLDEIDAAAHQGEAHCTQILGESWLGDPPVLTPAERRLVTKLRISLSDGQRPPQGHRGEAESIVLAEKHGGMLATDDNAAYQFATRRSKLGLTRVIDTVDILRSAVEQEVITAQEAVDIADDIEAVDRWLRPVHDGQIRTEYFEPVF